MCISKVKYVSVCFALILSFCFLLAACSTREVNETVRYEQYIAYCKNKLADSPSPAVARNLKAGIGTRYLYLGESVVAIRWLEEALDIKDDSMVKDEPVIINLAAAYSIAKKYDSAKENYLKLLNTSYRQQGLEGLGTTCLKLKEYEKALGYYNKLSLEKPDFVPYSDMSSCYEKMGDIDSALKERKKAAESTKNCLPEQAELLRLKILAGEQVEKSYEKLLELYQSNPGHTYILYALSTYFFENGDYDKAREWIKLLKTSLESKPCYRCKRSGIMVSLYSFDPDDANELLAKIEALPCALGVNIAFSDISSLLPNNTIDAAEQSTITATITNNGKGAAFDVKLETESPYKNIDFLKTISVGDIQPGESKKVNVAINSALDLKDGIVPFNIQAKEKCGYDSKRYTLNVLAAHLDKPLLVVTGYKINDSNTGLAKGNGNGIPENSETIEIISFVKNTGVGSAIKVNLSLDITTNGIVIERKEIAIPKIMPGQTVTGNLAFSIPRTFSGGEIRIDLAASDVRGASDAKKLVALNTESHQPVLAYTYKIIDRNKDGFLENGEEGEIEILPSNKGRMDASDIRLDLDSDDIVLSKKAMSIDRISAQSKYVPLRFAFKVPRTLEKDSIDISIKFRQKDFQGLNDTINVPVRLVVPDFQITHQILDPNNNGIIEQGETIDLIVRIRNVGGLDAEGVVLNLDFNKTGVILSGEKRVSIGRIPAGGESEPKAFTIHVQRRASQGTLPVQFAVTQKSFKNKTISLALAIAEEQAEVITVAGRNKSKKSYSIDSAGHNMAPIIVIASPRDNKRVASSSEVLTGTIADDRGVANIEIFVNGKRLDATRSISVVGKPGQGQKEREFRAQIPLQKGKNEIIVTALDIENLSSSKSVTIYRESQRGELWAAVIGINRYRNSKISLKYARNDAKAFADYLRNHMGLDDNHLFELYDAQASLRNIRSVLGTKLRRKADSPEDTVYIFFAGHGAPLEDYTSKDRDGISKYILPYDADLEDIYSTAMPMDEIARIFSAIRAERVIFIADSCYSGGVGGRTILSQGRRAKLSDAFLDRMAQAGKGRIILTSSNANEVSQESDKLSHGYFTYYLLEGLKGKADVDGDSLIDIDEIYRYLNKQVPEKTNGAQHPVKKGEAEGHVIIGRVK